MNAGFQYNKWERVQHNASVVENNEDRLMMVALNCERILLENIRFSVVQETRELDIHYFNTLLHSQSYII